MASIALKRAVEINQGRGFSGIPVFCHSFRAAEKASCMASSARSRSPSRRTRLARILPESDLYSASSDWRTCSGEQSAIGPEGRKGGSPKQWSERRPLACHLRQPFFHPPFIRAINLLIRGLANIFHLLPWRLKCDLRPSGLIKELGRQENWAMRKGEQT